MDQILFRLRRNVGVWGQVNFTKSNPLTCKCNPQYSTRSFSLTFHLNGAIGVDQILFRWRRNVGVRGPGKFHEIKSTDLFRIRWKLQLISAERQMITYSNVGDMANGSMPGSLRSFHASCLASSILTGTPNGHQSVSPAIPIWRPCKLKLITETLSQRS